jgi:hypothetical protein
MGRVVLWSLWARLEAALKALRHPKAEFSTDRSWDGAAGLPPRPGQPRRLSLREFGRG